jgi:curved DNA-binding protein CbpA
MDPYHILGVDPKADDKTIRQAYLKMIRAHTPERDPDGFRAIAGAYEAIKSEEQRVQRLLQPNEVDADSPKELLRAYAALGTQRPMSSDSMRSFLRSLA